MMIPYDTIHICIYAQGLVWATIINIHILTSLTYNSADLQACYLANIIYIVQLDS